MELKQLIKKDTTISVAYPDPDFKDFKIKVAYVSREAMLEIRKQCVTHTYNKKTRAMEESLDEDKFIEAYVSATIKGWEGFKYKYLAEILPIDISSVDAEEVLPYSQSNAVMMMQECQTFEAVVGDMLGDIKNFSNA